LKPIVGIVVTTSPIYCLSISISLHRVLLGARPSVCITVLFYRHYPAERTLLASLLLNRVRRYTSPKINILISFFAHSNPDIHETVAPILYCCPLPPNYKSTSLHPLLNLFLCVSQNIVLENNLRFVNRYRRRVGESSASLCRA
jgi:hypothetical protein